MLFFTRRSCSLSWRHRAMKVLCGPTKLIPTRGSRTLLRLVKSISKLTAFECVKFMCAMLLGCCSLFCGTRSLKSNLQIACHSATSLPLKTSLLGQPVQQVWSVGVEACLWDTMGWLPVVQAVVICLWDASLVDCIESFLEKVVWVVNVEYLMKNTEIGRIEP